MIYLIFYLSLALGVSFLCSIMESVLLSVSPSFAAALEQKKPKIGRDLQKLKKDIDRPLAAILSLNTVAHTVGAAGVGAQAMVVFGNQYVAVISGILTFLILIFSEIIPKTLGAIYWRKLAPLATRILKGLIVMLYPLVWLSRKITLIFSKKKRILSFSRDEIRAMADIGLEEGLFLKQESRILKNLMRFGSLSAKDIMTPQPVIFTLPGDMTIEEVFKQYPVLKFSRIPIYGEDHDHIQNYVLKNDILLNIALENTNLKLKQVSKEILVVPEMVSLFRLFEKFLDTREQTALVVDEYGGVAGLVTMEDIIETLLGIEIVDETDTTTDMQKLARQQWIKRAKLLGLVSDAAAPQNKKKNNKSE